MLVSSDNYAFPCWAPDWLRQAVESPDCIEGTHPTLRKLAKWLAIYFSDDISTVERWLRYAAGRCARDVPDGEVERLIVWAQNGFATGGNGRPDDAKEPATQMRPSPPRAARADLEEIYSIAAAGPGLGEYEAASPQRMGGLRKTAEVLSVWAHYAGEPDPLVCFGADDRFWTRQLGSVHQSLYLHAQIVPSPMRAPFALTQTGKISEHTKEGTGARTFLVTEFDFSKATPKGNPTIWLPLLERCEAAGITVLDLNAALLSHLASDRPLWMTVFSGGKSLQGWFPCRGESEETLHEWFNARARRLGACSSTWCKSQFVRMPDGTRAPKAEGEASARQSIVYYDPSVL